jgi:DNA-binding response OmpR family regulator
MNVSTFLPSENWVKAPAQRQSILVAEDDALIRQINLETLAAAGYDVDGAEDGEAAWDLLQMKSYDLLVTDNQMPKVSGVELIRKIRDARMRIPVIMATGNMPAEEFERHPWVQPFTIMLKPYCHEELRGTVNAVLYANAGQRAVGSLSSIFAPVNQLKHLMPPTASIPLPC